MTVEKLLESARTYLNDWGVNVQGIDHLELIRDLMKVVMTFRTTMDSMKTTHQAELENLNGQVEHWKAKYRNKIYAND